MNAGIAPAANMAALVAAVASAAAGGATMLFTPEMSNLIDSNRTRALRSICPESDDRVLAAVRDAAGRHAIWVALGSLALTGADGDARSVNRSILIAADGSIAARYDKVHLFDVDLATGESWRESSAYRPGERAVIAPTPLGILGLSVCYDLRFPALYQAMSDRGAVALAVPAAFTVPTGTAHWHVLLRARAIENAAFVIAAAQAGAHEDGRETFGHSLVVDPWGEILLDLGTAPALAYCDIDLAQVAAVRRRIPVIAHRRVFATSDT